jgi:hypothetical protein
MVGLGLTPGIADVSARARTALGSRRLLSNPEFVTIIRKCSGSFRRIVVSAVLQEKSKSRTTV